MRPLYRLILLSLLVPSALLAQKRCKKGIPCGGACIAANKTCRISTPSPRPVEARASTAAPSASASDGEWVASSRGSTYYRAGCRGANKLSAGNRIAFKTEEEAQAAGYKRSRSKGC